MSFLRVLWLAVRLSSKERTRVWRQNMPRARLIVLVMMWVCLWGEVEAGGVPIGQIMRAHVKDVVVPATTRCVCVCVSVCV